KNYFDGKYSTLKLPDKSTSITSSNTDGSLNYGINETAALYTYRGKNDTQQIIATTNHVAYSLYDGKELPIGAKCPGGSLYCHYCRLDYKTAAVGIPVSYKEHKDNKTNTKSYIFYCEGLFCSYECALAALKMHVGLPALSRDS